MPNNTLDAFAPSSNSIKKIRNPFLMLFELVLVLLHFACIITTCSKFEFNAAFIGLGLSWHLYILASFCSWYQASSSFDKNFDAELLNFEYKAIASAYFIFGSLIFLTAWGAPSINLLDLSAIFYDVLMTGDSPILKNVEVYSLTPFMLYITSGTFSIIYGFFIFFISKNRISEILIDADRSD
jgi:hypothetical protein